jgi:hypothetical protein
MLVVEMHFWNRLPTYRRSSSGREEALGVGKEVQSMIQYGTRAGVPIEYNRKSLEPEAFIT